MTNEERGTLVKKAFAIQCALSDIEHGDSYRAFVAAEYIQSIAKEAAEAAWNAFEKEDVAA